MKTSNANKFISVLMSVAMCPMMVPSAAFAADDDTASGGGSLSSTELIQPPGQTEGTDTGASSGTTSTTQSAAAGTTTTSSENAALAAATNEAAAPTAETREEGTGEAVAKVGETTYTTLENAFAALSSSNRTLTLLNESAWNATTPVYYKAGEASGYVAKLTDALTAAYQANAGDITIVCRPGSDLGTMTHGHVADNITIYGNGAYISGGECDLEVDTYQFSRETGKQTKDAVTELAGKIITINAYDVDNLGVWGQRNTNATVNVNLTNCDGKDLGTANVQRAYISGTSGVNNITLTDCDFITANTAVYSNADGTVAVNNCSFTGSIVPVNFNHKATGTQTVTVSNSTFTNCGTAGEWAAFAAPARFVNSAAGTLNATISGCSFAGTVGVNGDILIGDGRTGQSSNEVALTVTNTTAKVQAQKPGYYGTGTTVVDESLKGEVATTPEKGLGSASIDSIVTPAPAGIAEVNGTSYPSLQEAISAAQDGETVTLLADVAEDVTIAAGKNITLDLGGKTLTNTSSGKATISVQGGTVTVKNGTVLGGTGYYNIEVTKGSNANLTLADVTATAGNNGSSMIDNWGTMTITSGTYTGGLDTVKNEPNAKLAITGGTFTLAKGNSDGFTGVVFNYGELTISGGEFIQSDNGAPYGQAQVIHTDKSGSATPSTVITGGTFKNLCTRDTAWTVRATNAAAGATKVSGGAFNKSVNKYYCADGFIPTKNADGTYGVATAIAQVGSSKYTSLQAAIKWAGKGKTVQLLNDTTENIEIVATKQIALDLNGHILNGGTGNAKATILNKGNLTITDTSADKTGTIKRDDQGVEGETSYYVIDNNGTMVIDQANVFNNSGSKGSSLIRNGGVDNTSSLTINGGTFEQQNFIAVKNDSNGELTINGGTLTSKQSVVQNWNKAKILGGSLKGGYLWTDAMNEEGAIGETVIGGDAYFSGRIYMDVTGENPSPSTLKVEGGSLNVTKWTVTEAATNADSSIAVSGGTFTATVPEAYCADGFALVANADGTYGVVAGVAQIGSKAYVSLADAVAAAKDGDTITLLSDCSGDGIVVRGDTFPNGLTIDFAGHSYTVGGKLVGSQGTASNGFQLLKGNTIVMRNGSIYGDASVAGDDTTRWSGSPAIMIQNYSSLTLDGMTVKGGKQTCYTLSNNNGDTVIKDSTIVAGQNKQVGGPWAFDVCRYASYPSVSVTVEGNSVIEGSVDVSGKIGEGQSRQLTITGGKFDKAINVSTKPANIAISGGTFATEVPVEYCAGGFTPVANSDGTYGVKLDKGAYLLQDYRSGDPASWTYPAQEDMAFAGWYKDSSFTTPCTESDVEGAAYAKFVEVTDLLQFKGGSLRMNAGDAAVSTNLRFGYTKTIPEGSKYVQNGWYFKKIGSSQSEIVRRPADNNVLNNDGTVTANLVFTGVTTNYYDAVFSEKAFVKYVTADGTTVEAVEGEYRQRSVKEVANLILKHSMASQSEKDYATKILAAQ